MTRHWEALEVDGSRMDALIVRPDTRQPAPAVLLCMHAPGIDAFMQDIADRLARVGYASITPDLFHRQPDDGTPPLEKLARLVDTEVLADQHAAHAHLKGLDGVDAERTAVIGFCMGGRCAWLQATDDPSLSAAVVFYGGMMFEPWSPGETPFERTPRLACPLLGLYGEEDQNPSPDDVARLRAELERLGKPHEIHTYPGAGHAFLNFVRESAHRPEAARDAWQRCEGWLARHLRA